MHSPPAPKIKPDYRADIDGLRAVAVILVVLFHAGFPVAPGGFVGVDVFFVISGFLITGMLVREAEAKGRIRLLDFWARRVRRILPAAVLVMVATLIAAGFLLSSTLVNNAARDLPATALYVVNWRLAEAAVDYFASDSAPSLYLQYWSLAIEEQYYVLWPLLIMLAAGLSTRFTRLRNVSRIILLLTLLLSLLSFAFCLFLTDANQPFAYFGTFSRMWQLGIGGAIALLPPVDLRPLLRQFLAIAGLAAVVAAGLTLDGVTAYPGLYALLPTLGTAAIILAGQGSGSGIAAWALSRPPLVQLGKWSYAWYLWHWPVLLLGTEVIPGLSATGQLLLISLSLALAILTYYLVEQPLRFLPALTRSARTSLAFGIGISLAAAGFGLVAQATFAKKTIFLSSGATIDALATDRDKAAVYKTGCHLEFTRTRYGTCAFANPSAEKTAVLIGDSHAAAWFPAVEEAARRQDWRLLSRTKSACGAFDIPQWNDSLGRIYRECASWQKSVLEEMARIQPDLIVLASSSYLPAGNPETGTRMTGEANRQALVQGEQTFVERLLDTTQAEIVLIHDVPRLPEKPLECLLAHPEEEDACSWPLSQTETIAQFPRGHYESDPRVRILDLNEQICPEGTCRAIREDIVVMRDRSHMTRTFAKRFSSAFEPFLSQAGRN